MAEGALTLGIPGSGNSDFASLPIPALVLDEWERQTSRRSPVGQLENSGYSLYGTAQITGPAHGIKYAWQVPAILGKDQARQLYRLFSWQQSNKLPLRLIDEVDELEEPDGRPLIATLTESYNVSLTYGYAVYAVWLRLPETWKQHLGQFSDATPAKLCTFTLQEA